jgi:pimeloyl-ACP methyl ester carboxylesterase
VVFVANTGGERRPADVNGVRLRVLDEGEGPLVLLLHGFPESAYSWRHQIAPLVAAGYRVVAPEQRGYGESSHPDSPDAYTIMHLVGDVVGLIADAGAQEAVVVGHDWGATVAWNIALMRPDLVRGVVGLSVPPRPRGSAPPVRRMQEVYEGRFYTGYFEQPEVADREFGRDVRASLRRFFHALSGDNPENPQPLLVPHGGGLLDGMPEPRESPEWLSEADLDVFVGQFDDLGFTGALDWYRNLDRNWELTAPFEGAALRMPALYVVGDRDPVLAFAHTSEALDALGRVHPGLREPVILPGCGHWTQQERPDEVTAELLGFLRSLPAPGQPGATS